MVSVFLWRLSSPVCTGWPHPKVRGQPSPAKRRNRHWKLSVWEWCCPWRGIHHKNAISNSGKGARSTCGVMLSRLANAQRNTFAHFSQDSHKSANNNNKKWEREQVFGRERYATIEGLLYWKMLSSVDSSICVETWDRKTQWQIRIQREAEREREGGGNERDEGEWGGKGERDKGQTDR